MARTQHIYQPLSEQDDVEIGDHEPGTPQPARFERAGSRCKDFLLISLCVALIFLSIANFRAMQPSAAALLAQQESEFNSMLTPALNEELWVRNHRITDYSYDHIDEIEAVDANWDAINPYIGIVALQSDWAREKGLPASDPLASDPTKGVYTLEAYHSLYCLTIVRRSMFQLARGQSLTAPFGHSMHCFDALRQHIMCNADETLLYTIKGTSAGDGQARKCRSWDALRNWAAEHHSCYYDDKSGVAVENMTGCEERKRLGDGMIMTDWVA